MKHKGKIISLGFNKTGTTSLHKAFKILGYTSAHCWTKERVNVQQLIWRNHRNGKKLLSGMEEYDAVSDWINLDSWKLFKDFDKQYPGTKFLLNIRDLDGWIQSRVKHIKRGVAKKGDRADWKEIEIENWTKEREEYHKQVREYFKGRPEDLLEVNIVQGDGWEKLAPFLGFDIPDVPFPRANKNIDKTVL